MPQRTLDYPSPEQNPRKPSNKAVRTAAGVSAACTISVNLALYCWAYSERGWGALVIFLWAILANFFLVLFYLAFIPSVRRAAGGESIRLYLLVSLLVPVVSSASLMADLYAIPPDEHAAP
jgi:hypothetical protein